MRVIRRLRRVGNSYIITIPKEIIEVLEMKIGDYLIVEIQNSFKRIKNEKDNEGDREDNKDSY